MAIVLCYHRVHRDPGPFTSSPELFRAHLEALRSDGYEFIGLAEFENAAASGFRKSAKQILVTTDDGYADNWFWGYPILRELGVPAVFFVITDAITEAGIRLRSDQVQSDTDSQSWPTRDERLSWSELRHMAADGLVSVQSHTAFHRDYSGLARKPEALSSSLDEDLADSIKAIENGVGRAPTALAWPWGFSTRAMRSRASEAGFAFQFSVVPGRNDFLTSHRLLHRYCCDGAPVTDVMRMISLLSRPLAGVVYSLGRLGVNRAKALVR